MKRISLAIGIFLAATLGVVLTRAQVVPGPPDIAAMICAANSSPPTPTNGSFYYVQCDSSGHLLTNASAGTVSSIGTAGLATGGPITTSGTVTVTGASKSDQQTGTSTTTVVTPSVANQSDSAAKAFIYLTQSGGTYTIAASYNASFAKTGTGTGTLTFTTPFASAAYALVCTTGGNNVIMNYIVLTASTATLNLQAATTGANTDISFSCVAFGRQ